MSMTRKDTILDGIDKHQFGLEIAPWHSPLAPKSEGYNVRILDVFDTATLKRRAQADPDVQPELAARIESVDYVGSACDIAEIVPAAEHGSFDYIISSHNFEHLPDPLKFLEGARMLLKPGGTLSMAVPDARGMFDYFRPTTVIGDWIEANVEGRKAPSPRQVFEALARTARWSGPDGETRNAFHQSEPFDKVAVTGNIAQQYDLWANGDEQEYRDCHCSVMTPASFELLVLEARALGLLSLELRLVRPSGAHEFYVRFEKPAETRAECPPADLAQRRTELARRAHHERSAVDHSLSRLAASFLRAATHPIQAWNRERLQKRRT